MRKLQRGERPRAQGERGTFTSRLLPFASLRPFSLGLVLLAGCTDLHQGVGNDPLLGGPPLRPSGPVTPTAPSQPTAVAIQPPPAANLTLSTAALAAGAPRPTNSSSELRIGAARSSVGND